MWDTGRLDRAQRVFGLASYLLVGDGLGASYAVAPDGDRDLYDVNPGLPTGRSGGRLRCVDAAVRVGRGGRQPGAGGRRRRPARRERRHVPAGGAVIDVGGTDHQQLRSGQLLTGGRRLGVCILPLRAR